MKKMTKAVIFPVLFILASAFAPVAEELAIGAAIPKGDMKLKDVATGKDVSLSSAKTAKGLLVIFSCNTCPYVKLNESRIKEAQEFCKTNGLGIVVVNSNEAQRDGDDSEAEMKAYAVAQGFTAPYVLDVKSELADAFGASRTPQCFLFDATGKLIYKGGIDDNVKDPKAVTKPYLKDALTAVMKGSKPEVQETKSIGCTIKRAE
jgi:thioredoxin-related protein